MQDYCSILFCQVDPITCTTVVKFWLSYCLHVQDSSEWERMRLGPSSRGAASFKKKKKTCLILDGYYFDHWCWWSNSYFCLPYRCFSGMWRVFKWKSGQRYQKLNNFKCNNYITLGTLHLHTSIPLYTYYFVKKQQRIYQDGKMMVLSSSACLSLSYPGLPKDFCNSHPTTLSVSLYWKKWTTWFQ